MFEIAALDRLYRPALAYLTLDAAPAPLRRLVDRIESSCQAARAAQAGLRLAASAQPSPTIHWARHAPELRHPLSPRWLARGGGQRGRDARSSTAAYAAFREHAAPLAAAWTQPDAAAWIAALLLAATPAGAAPATLRSSAVMLEADADGTRVEFGPWNDVPARLRLLWAAHRASALPASVRAIAALALLLNIHPLEDGNGRLARLLFQVTLNAGQADVLYLPLKEAIDVSDGGFEIRLRDAEVNANWAPLLLWFNTVFLAVSEAATASAGADYVC